MSAPTYIIALPRTRCDLGEIFDDRLGPVHHQAEFTNYLMIADALEDEPGPRIEISLSIFIFWPVGQDRRYESKRSFT